MKVKTFFLSFIAITSLTSCGPLKLYDEGTVDPSDVASLSIESSPNTMIEDTLINNNPIFPPRPVSVSFGEQQIEFKYFYEDKDNPTLTPAFHGVCKGSFYARAGNSYTITTAGVWLNQAKEDRFWVVQPEREEIGSVACSKVDEHSDSKLFEKNVLERNVLEQKVERDAERELQVTESDATPFKEQDLKSETFREERRNNSDSRPPTIQDDRRY